YAVNAAPWDIGGPQPVIRQLVALGAVRGEVDLDFGRVIATATGNADSSSELSPIAQEGKTVVQSAPPEGTLEGTGYWVIDPALGQDTPTRPASTPGP
ncbi:hypothetical protein P5V98_25025, partial [Mycobacteroides abscessus subsp. massiliense]|nr:hypothetical protein [Mycobacteroides abscessus subsp. massiliense]